MKPEYAVLFFILGTILIAILHSYELPLLALMLLCSAAVLGPDKWRNLKMFLISTLVGGMCEVISVALGVWHYSTQSFFVLPLWVPIAWGMAMVLFEEAFTDRKAPGFSIMAVVLAFAGTIAVCVSAANELFVLFSFVIVTIALFVFFYKKSELRAGVLAGLFGAGMEVVCIMNGGWSYPVAMFGAPVWLPFAWLNAFLIMRRISK